MKKITLKQIVLTLCLVFTTTLCWTMPVIKIIVPAPNSGPATTVALQVQRTLSQELKTTVLLEYRPGGGGSIAVNQLLAVPTNSREIVLHIGTSAVVFNTFKNPAPYDYQRLRPVVNVGYMPLVFVVNKQFGITNIKQWHQLSTVTTVFYGSAGVGTVGNFIMEAVNLTYKKNLIHVPYQGTSYVVTALLSGDINCAFMFFGSARPYIESGDYFPIAVDADHRLVSMPEVPTLAELQIPNYGNLSNFTIFASKDLSEQNIKMIQTAMVKILTDPEQSKLFLDKGILIQKNNIIPPDNFFVQQRTRVRNVMHKITLE